MINGEPFFERSMFYGNGGFDEDLPPGPEDWDMDNRLKKIGSISLLNNQAGLVSWEMDSFVEKRGIFLIPSMSACITMNLNRVSLVISKRSSIILRA